MTLSAFYAISFDTSGYDQEVWMAMLSDWPFESFHEEDGRLTGYILKNEWTDEMKLFIEGNKSQWYNAVEVMEVPDQNWNAVWESSFSPVPVGSFCYIRASFHGPAPLGFKHELIIAPKMAFGTGHHATTYMMIQAMSNLDFNRKRVLDFGCGTGILSVVAAFEGASSVVGIDIQPEAIENSLEHAMLNHVSAQCEFLEGGLEKAGVIPFDVILANINTKIIINHFEDLKRLLNPGGYLLLSGIMSGDMEQIDQNLDLPPLEKVEQHQREDWMQITLMKNE